MKSKWLWRTTAALVAIVSAISASDLIAAPLWQDKEGAEKKVEPTQEEQATEEPATPEEKLKVWTKKFTEEMAAFQTAVRAAKSAEERREASKLAPKTATYVENFVKLAEENPKSEIALKALAWVAQNGRGMPAATKALNQIVEEFPEAKELENLVGLLASGAPDPQTEVLLQKVIDNSPHETVKGKATYALASTLKRLVDLNERLASDEQMMENYTRQVGEKGAEYLKSVGTDTTRIAALFKKIVDEYGDIEMGTRTLGKIAKGALFEMENLAIGKIVPEIEGQDFDEVSFKLSDYRGKVVVIDFWGDW